MGLRTNCHSGSVRVPIYPHYRCMDIIVTTGQPECECNTPDKDSRRSSNKEVIEQIVSYNIRFMK